jgi:hypothetical protein
MPSFEFSQSRPAPPAQTAIPRSFDEPNRGVTRRRIVVAATASLAASGGLAVVAIRTLSRKQPAAHVALDIYEQIVPEKGIDTGVVFGDAIQKVIAAGALDPEKLRAHGYAQPHWVERLLAAPSQEPIVFTRSRAPYLVNLLWPIGLSNRVVFNRQSPINTDYLPGFASTGGWTLGRAPNGSVYFDTIDAVPITGRQAFLVLVIATNTFRPCCDNNTLFQDCNHGSALLGLIEWRRHRAQRRRRSIGSRSRPTRTGSPNNTHGRRSTFRISRTVRGAGCQRRRS